MIDWEVYAFKIDVPEYWYTEYDDGFTDVVEVYPDAQVGTMHGVISNVNELLFYPEQTYFN